MIPINFSENVSCHRKADVAVSGLQSISPEIWLQNPTWFYEKEVQHVVNNCESVLLGNWSPIASIFKTLILNLVLNNKRQIHVANGVEDVL